jgi:hypothetical protein
MISRLYCDNQQLCDGTPLAHSTVSKECTMIESDVERYVREHEDRIRRLDELHENISSSEYNEEEKQNFKRESLKLCLKGLATV